jgi:hypothetical protein
MLIRLSRRLRSLPLSVTAERGSANRNICCGSGTFVIRRDTRKQTRQRATLGDVPITYPPAELRHKKTSICSDFADTGLTALQSAHQTIHARQVSGHISLLSDGAKLCRTRRGDACAPPAGNVRPAVRVASMNIRCNRFQVTYAF